MFTKITGRTFNHITLGEIKKQLRIHENFTDDDALLLSFLQVASDVAANHIENTISLTDLQTVVKDFSGDHIVIDQGNFQSITSISYVSKLGETISLTEDDDYTVEADEFSFIIFFSPILDGVKLTINYKCGFTDLNIPPVVKQAILIKLCDLYDIERSSYTSNTFKENKAFESLLNYHKKISFL